MARAFLTYKKTFLPKCWNYPKQIVSMFSSLRKQNFLRQQHSDLYKKQFQAKAVSLDEAKTNPLG